MGWLVSEVLSPAHTAAVAPAESLPRVSEALETAPDDVRVGWANPGLATAAAAAGIRGVAWFREVDRRREGGMEE